MFHKIRVQLAALNAVVFFLILIVCGASLYLYMQFHLFEQIDDSIRKTALQPQPNARKIGLPGDRPTVTLYWNSLGQLIRQSPDDMLDDEDLAYFRDQRLSQDPQTVSRNDHKYRVLNMQFKGPKRMMLPENVAAVSTVQAIRNIDAEEDTLTRLLVVVVISMLLGGGATVWAGFFLSGRALVPIRISWEKQQQFVADASHELRTPLAVIRSHAELMLRHPEQTIEQQSRNISAVLKETGRMSKLVSSLLTLARTDSDQLEVKRAPMRLDEVAGRVAEEFAVLAEFEGLKLQARIEGEIEWQADEERIVQLMVILLDNAMKYTPSPGTITLTCRRHNQAVELIVDDTGIGIDAEEIPYIFDRFYRGDKVRSREEGGTGLGLSIAKWIVEAHQGKIRVESQRGKGTRMHITFS